LVPAFQGGYSAGSTDSGNLGEFFDLLPAVITSNREINWPLVKNYSSRSVHDMAVIGKSVTKKYYGTVPKYSYFDGYSTGSREGYTEAQTYPGDFDGIIAVSPVAKAAKVTVAMQWPYTVMIQEKRVPSECVFNAFVNASIAECDGLDSVLDGLISNIQECAFDPYTMVGTQVACDGGIVTIDEATVRQHLVLCVSTLVLIRELAYSYAVLCTSQNRNCPFDSLPETALIRKLLTFP
jgi:hypothetical protein